MRLGNALLGATAAKPTNTACINGRPCAARSEVLLTLRVDDRLMSVIYPTDVESIKDDHEYKSEQLTRKLQAATSEYLSCTDSVLMAHCTRASSKPGGKV